MSARERKLLVLSLVTIDALAIAGALVAAFYVRYESNWLPLIERLEPITERYVFVIPAAIPLWLIMFAFNGLYDLRQTLSGLQQYGRIFSASAFGIILLIVLSFVEPNVSISRAWLALSWAFALLFVSAGRFSFRQLVKRLRARGALISRAIIVGANEQGKMIARQLAPAAESGVQVVGFVDDFLPRETQVVDELRVLDRPAALARVASETRASEAIVVQGAVAWESFAEIIARSVSSLNGIQIKLSPGFYEIMATGVRVSHAGFVPLLALEKNRVTGLDALLKTTLDYSVAVLMLVLLSPLFLLTMLMVRFSSQGPIFESYPVAGVGGKEFTTWKFRTRRNDSEDHALGKPIYRLGLDKLPQLWSVLQGRMSIVGPRPIPLARAQVYQEWLPTLYSVKPGLTGPWVVAGAAADSLEAEIRLDLFYTRNWTIWLDLQIILQTVLRLFQGERPSVTR